MKLFAELAQDDEFKFLTAEGFEGSLNDMIVKYLADQGIDLASVSDMLADWEANGGSGWAPSDITSSLASFEFDKVGSVTVDGNDKVTDWASLDGSVSFTQSTEARRPALTADGLDWGSSASNPFGLTTPDLGANSVYEIWWVMKSDDSGRETWGNFTDFIGGSSANVDRLTMVSNGAWSKPTGSTLYQNNAANEAWLPYNVSSFSVTATTAIPFPLFGNRDGYDRGPTGTLKALYIFGGASSADVPTDEERTALQSYLVGKYGTLS